jgi:hypothetical protein
MIRNDVIQIRILRGDLDKQGIHAVIDSDNHTNGPPLPEALRYDKEAVILICVRITRRVKLNICGMPTENRS